MKEWIVFQNPHFLVANKPAGILSQGDKSGDEDLAGLLRKSGGYPFLAPVHRLDRNTSGALVLAKSPQAAKTLSRALQENRLERTYLAIAKGDPGESGTYDFRLRKKTETNEVFVDAKGEEAVTQYRRLQHLGNSALMQVRLLTGRSHQIRVHFAHAGHALLGDKKYAKKPWSEVFRRPALHAWKLSLRDPELGDHDWLAEIPEDFLGLLSRLGGKAPT